MRAIVPGAAAKKDRSGFTLIEVLVVIVIVAALCTLLLPALGRGKLSARKIKCVSNLHQLGLATHLYWDENQGRCFRYEVGPTNGGRLYWFGWIGPGSEGNREFDASQGSLFSHLRGRGVELCPAFDYSAAVVKLKANGATYGYGYNLCLDGKPPVNTTRIRQPARTVLMADAAQINTWQPPASPDHPLLEEWYYVDDSTNQPNGHFRHSKRANVLFCDGHVGAEGFVEGSIDLRMPSLWVGRLRTEILTLP
jgi:prepilin-type processing-associated H-X9-DG protein/prepilin-type N-terminal cleavage/methylation domain-containing protein